MSAAPFTFTFDTCDRDLVNIPQAIQPHGFLLAASGWRRSNASSNGTAAGSGPRENSTPAPPFIFHFPGNLLKFTQHLPRLMLKPILLVEDNADDLELALRALAKTNLANDVVTARDGEQALHYLLREGPFADRPSGNPAVILLDLKLPKIDGIQVLERIRRHEELHTVPVVMLTASRMESDLSRAYDLGVNAYVVKPMNFMDFIEAVRELGIFWAVLNEPPPGSFKPIIRRAGS